MKYIVKNTKALKTSMVFNDENTQVTFQAETQISVEGNPYADIAGSVTKPALYTPVTLFKLVCDVKDIPIIDEVAHTQAKEWVKLNYPETE